MHPLYTVGHSNHSIERLLELLEGHAVTAVADVRSLPFSRYNPQFNRENLQKSIKGAGMEYVFLGKELGARSEDRSCFVDGRLQFDLLARSELFQKGLARLRKGMETHRIALLCAEKDPVTCHRMILVCRNMRRDDYAIRHILEDGIIEENSESERRLMRSLGISECNLFATAEELIEKAYDLQGAKIAFEEKTSA
jgi:uncharacterized protein (DUF488 family)